MISAAQRPTKSWSILVLGAAGAFAVLLSYVVIVGLAVGGLALPWIFVRHGAFDGHANLMYPVLLSLFGVLAGISILWSLKPRQEQFTAPGAAIDLSREKRLASEIEAIACALGQEMPSEVYLIADANAFVAQPAGRRRKILALGLPLLQALTVSEFRAILAHEFAHFYSGDTRLGPWLYKSRSAILRVYQSLGSKSLFYPIFRIHGVTRAAYALMMALLRGYWIAFMRATQLISRRQEFRSDELACYVAGSGSLIRSLEAVNRCGAVSNHYWNAVVLPAVGQGFRPQLADSFGRYLAAPDIAEAAAAFVAQRRETSKSDPFDTHPPLGARIARARSLGLDGSHQMTPSDAPAISLIDNLESLELSLLRQLFPAADSTAMKPLVWETSAADLYIPAWRQEIAPFVPVLAATALGALPELVLDPEPIAKRIPVPRGKVLTKAQRAQRIERILSLALTVSLFDRGWTLDIQPGSRTLHFGGVTLTATEVIAQLRTKPTGAREWREVCEQTGIDTWPLAAMPSGGGIE